MLESAAGGRVLVADLSLGSWRAFDAAGQILAQLGVGSPDLVSPVPVADDISSYADFIGWAIDKETSAMGYLHVALDLARRALAASDAGGETTVVVLAPRFGMGWEPGDAAFVRFLAEGALRSSSRCRIIIGCARGSTAPEDLMLQWDSRENRPESIDGRSTGASPPMSSPHGDPVAIVPGVVRAEDLVVLSNRTDASGIFLADGSFVVAPDLRRDPRTAPAVSFDWIAANPLMPSWLRAYAQVHGSNLFVDPWLLWSEAMTLLAQSDMRIAARLVERALGSAIGSDLEGPLASLLSGILIASRRYADLAQSPDPRQGLPAAVRAFLLHAKGWGLVMTGAAAAADQCFGQALVLLRDDSSPTREELYLLNIWALGRFRQNDLDGALALERSIAEGHRALGLNDARLRYVNGMNLARVQRRLGRPADASQDLVRAFESVRGVATLSDCLYANLCFARVYADLGDRRRELRALIRAALHWASSELPEAIGPRVTGAILEERAGGNTDDDSVARVLADRLLEAAGRSGLRSPYRVEGDARWVPTIVRIDGDPAAAPPPSIAVLGSGWSVVASRARYEAPYDSSDHRRLRATLRALLAVTGPPGALEGVRTIGVSDDCGRGMPVTARGAIAMGLRLRTSRVVGNRVDVDTARCAVDFEPRLVAAVGAGVRSVTPSGRGLTCAFWRYLPDYHLEVDEASLVESLGDTPSVDTLARRTSRSIPELMSGLRLLEARRVIDLSLAMRSRRPNGVPFPVAVADAQRSGSTSGGHSSHDSPLAERRRLLPDAPPAGASFHPLASRDLPVR